MTGSASREGALLASIVSVAADAIVTVDEEQRILIFNAGAEEIFGWSAEEVLGAPLDLLLPEQVRERHRAHIAAFERSGERARRMGERREIHGRRRDGTLFPAEASISRVELDGRHFYTAVLRDVSERKRVEQELQRLLDDAREARAAAEAEELRSRVLAEASALLEHTLDHEETLRRIAYLLVPRLASFALIDVIDETGAAIRVQALHADPGRAELARRFGSLTLDRSRPYLLHRALEEGTAELVERMSEERLRAMSQGETHFAMLRELAPHSMLAVPLRAGGRVLGAMGLFACDDRAVYGEGDVRMAVVLGDRAGQAILNARLYRQAHSATRLREEMLGIVSHDLRNPLSAISTCASALLEEPSSWRGAQLELLGTIQESARWAQRMIADLLDVASIEAGRLSLERRRVRVGGLLSRACDLFAEQARQGGVGLDVAPIAGELFVEGDDERLMQVLANLIANALRFTSGAGRVRLAARPQGGEVEISVSDTGTGIPPAHLPHLFDRFWQARRGSAARGTGLGMAICKGIVEAHGGRITVHSSIGEGTTVAFTLPAGAAYGA